VPGEKISLLPNACDPQRFRPLERDAELAAELGLPPDVPVIGYAGTFNRYEGLDLLMQACGSLKDQNFRLLLVGSEPDGRTGSLTLELREQAEHTDMAGKAILTGRVPHDQIERYYSLMDICPFPRLPLPVCELVSPLKPLEAMGMGKAVLVSDVKGMEEMVEHEKTGLHFPAGDARKLGETLRLLLDDAALRARLGEQGREWALAERNWEKVVEPLGKVFDALMKQQEMQK
jgi:glycosyltransferase involved in cell wall biosynthesis